MIDHAVFMAIAGYIAASIAASAAVIAFILFVAWSYSQIMYRLNPPPDRAAIAARKIASLRRRSFIERRARRKAKREYIAARDTMKPECFREWADERRHRAYEEWADRQQSAT